MGTRFVALFVVMFGLAANFLNPAESSAQTRGASLKAPGCCDNVNMATPAMRAQRAIYAKYWKEIRTDRSQRLERLLAAGERLMSQGRDVDPVVAQIKKEFPQFAKMSLVLRQQLQGASCTGIGWIGKNGKLRCIGKLTLG